MHIQIISNLDQVSRSAWNALVQDNNPFVRHEFLAALEHHQCVSKQFGWLPRHIAVYEGEELLGAMPLYEKYNSYGEFVFDHAWAEAYKQHKLRYYPKLVSAIPYTPASGQRLLVKSGQETEIYPVLLESALQLAETLQASGVHWLFPLGEEQDWLSQQQLFTRHDCQFHWRNFGYQSFDDFLETFSSKKRKNVKQERRKVKDAGVELRVLDGYSATATDWERFAFFYQHTFESKWGIPTLNEGFFKEVAAKLPDQVILVMADKNGECIAGSLMFRSDTRLYGRHWGCTEYFDSLHFEACYYQGIEYCIQHHLQVFEPGAQGEHKVPRGFIPTLTRSSHWLASPAFQQAVRQHTLYEQRSVAEYMQSVYEHLPYREDFVAEHLRP
ncbi:GNAT family N-acetyltransferase [uncultured Thiothrix sp.]|uniref:GNAT family N-acetyltransferase n=1 Tax=uncultured Thiothrix sp. TaxID=223185 RepID=UPI00260F6F6D|nr:GNAT family N-acetyltransferase [uncultured Thiothrix sp.]